MALKEKKIIIIDDEKGIRSVLSKVLRAEGYNVLNYPSCEHLLSKISVNPPDLIILDLMLPWESGESFLKKIKSIKKYSNIPIVVISGKIVKDLEIQRVIDKGADAFLTKPMDIDELIDKVNGLLDVEAVT